MPQLLPSSDFLKYIATHREPQENSTRLPSLAALSNELGLSVSTLREQMEVARAMGLVEARPRTGLRTLPYSFTPAVRQSLSFAIALDRAYFDSFADLRKHVEITYWHEAVVRLLPVDHVALKTLVIQAWQKLRGEPIEIPQGEHRELHLLVYRRLNNSFVMGLLEAYWDAYEAVGLNVYTDYAYLQNVWKYHQIMVDSICSGDFATGYHALLEHTDLLFHRSASVSVSPDPNLLTPFPIPKE